MKAICCWWRESPKWWGFLSLFFLFLFFRFLFFLFFGFFCLFLFRIIFIRICYGINRNLLCLDKQRSGLVTCSKWWAMRYSRKNPNRWQRGEFPGCSWKTRGISTGLGFWPLEFPPTRAGFPLSKGSLRIF